MTAGFGAPSLVAKKARTFLVPNSSCAVPKAAAYAANFVVGVPAGKTVGWLAAWPDDIGWPGTVVVNAAQGGIIGNFAVVAAGADGGIQVLATDDTDLVGAGQGLKLRDSEIVAAGAGSNVGIQPTNSTVQVVSSDVNAGASGADFDAHGTGSVKAYGSILRGGNLKSDGGKVQIAASEVVSGVVLNNAAITCVASFNDQGLTVNPATCN
jgi:hypothetical protein